MKARALLAKAMCALEIVFMQEKKKNKREQDQSGWKEKPRGTSASVVLTVWSESHSTGSTFVSIMH